MNNKLIKRFAIIFIIPILMVSVFLFSQYEDHKKSQTEYGHVRNRSEERLRNFLDLVLKERCEEIQDDVELRSEAFAKELLHTYSNGDAFEKDMNIVDRYTDLDELLNKHFSGQYFQENSSKYNNHILVSVNDMILYDKSGIYPYRENEQRTYNEILEYSHNKNLTSTAISNIRDCNLEKHNYIFWETLPNSNPNHYMIDNMSVDDLIDLYYKEGLAGFKSIDLLIPVYITEDGDIFGTKDVNRLGYKQDNYKIAVIQRINMYDLLSEYRHYLDQYVSDLSILTNYFDSNGWKNFIMSIYSLITLVLLIGMYANIQNKWVQSEENKNIE